MFTSVVKYARGLAEGSEQLEGGAGRKEKHSQRQGHTPHTMEARHLLEKPWRELERDAWTLTVCLIGI